jgi:hypothetical protein
MNLYTRLKRLPRDSGRPLRGVGEVNTVEQSMVYNRKKRGHRGED